MNDEPVKHLIDTLRERAKELNCLYDVDAVLSKVDGSLDNIGADLVERIPRGWQFPEVCVARLVIDDRLFESRGFVETEWMMSSRIHALGEDVGTISVYYTEERPHIDEGPFLKEERRLIDAIAERIGLFILQRRLRRTHESWVTTVDTMSESGRGEWDFLLDFLRRTEPELLTRITRKMINQLAWVGVEDAQRLLEEYLNTQEEALPEGENRPIRRARAEDARQLVERTFSVAAGHFSEEEMVRLVQAWLEEEKCVQLMSALEQHWGLAETADALSRFQAAAVDENSLPTAVQRSLRVALLTGVFSDHMEFVNIGRDHVRIGSFYDLFRRIIHPSRSYGKLGGKSAGIFLASQVLERFAGTSKLLEDIRTPMTWYITSDTLLHFMHYNNLEDLYNIKYLDIERVRREYPHVVQVFKSSRFPPDIVAALSAALDEFEDKPIIVRSSSLLEDRQGTAFSGKYKSLFIANQGSKKDRLEALMDAIAEVYASVFGPDPIQYRAERGLLDVHEEMGIMIQEVVGTRVGKYYMPAFSGVVFSNNEFRWSARIRREDGLVRMVPGLGTRAVDRVSDDYPVLLAPGQPGLRVNLPADEVVRYCPKRMDVINLEKNRFETVDIDDLLGETRNDFPLVRHVVSIVEQDRVRRPVGLEPDWDSDDVVVTFQGLFSDTPFVARIHEIIKVLREQLRMPIDIEFACDDKHFYLLQCRAQSYAGDRVPAPIPRDLPKKKILFAATRHISNGHVPDVTHIVYVDPQEYANLPHLNAMKSVGRAVSELNRLLPKRQFILMGPGRWGSRGDIRLGVDVTYSDISNTAVLMEIAHTTGEYTPELSFGTHFFQDLVEADILYIPIYPDDEDSVLNEVFLRRARNILAEVLPRYAELESVVRVIDVRAATEGEILDIRMNADLDEAVGVLATPSGEVARRAPTLSAEAQSEDHWRWRLTMAEQIAANIDGDAFDVKAAYVFGSTKNGTAGPGSDLDLILHVGGDEQKRRALALWLDGWSLSLANVNYLRTGYRTDGLLDVHYVTDADIERKSSFAAKIGAVTDAARPLAMGGALRDG